MDWTDIRGALTDRIAAITRAEAFIGSFPGTGAEAGFDAYRIAFSALDPRAREAVLTLLCYDLGRLVAAPGREPSTLKDVADTLGIAFMGETGYASLAGTAWDGGTGPWFGGFPNVNLKREAAETALAFILCDRDPTDAELVSLGFFHEVVEADVAPDVWTGMLEAHRGVSEPEIGLARVPRTPDAVFEVVDTVEF